MRHPSVPVYRARPARRSRSPRRRRERGRGRGLSANTRPLDPILEVPEPESSRESSSVLHQQEEPMLISVIPAQIGHVETCWCRKCCPHPSDRGSSDQDQSSMDSESEESLAGEGVHQRDCSCEQCLDLESSQWNRPSQQPPSPPFSKKHGLNCGCPDCQGRGGAIC